MKVCWCPSPGTTWLEPVACSPQAGSHTLSQAAEALPQRATIWTRGRSHFCPAKGNFTTTASFLGDLGYLRLQGSLIRLFPRTEFCFAAVSVSKRTDTIPGRASMAHRPEGMGEGPGKSIRWMSCWRLPALGTSLQSLRMGNSVK